LSAAKNPGILHVADFVQNDKLTCAEFSQPIVARRALRSRERIN